MANAAAEATPAAFQLNETTWTFTDKDGKAVQESIDASGNYIANAGEKHVDHGTSVMKDGKACFTSAMDKQGETCWTTQPVEIGQSMETTAGCSRIGRGATVSSIQGLCGISLRFDLWSTPF